MGAGDRHLKGVALLAGVCGLPPSPADAADHPAQPRDLLKGPHTHGHLLGPKLRQQADDLRLFILLVQYSSTSNRQRTTMSVHGAAPSSNSPITQIK